MELTDTNFIGSLPQQKLPFNKKTVEWRKKHLDWATFKSYFNDSAVRKSVIHKRINFNLLNGKVDYTDMELVLNPESVRAEFITERVPHYPIINSKLNVLIGEESKRTFDYKVMITNPTAISEKENTKREELFNKLKEIIMSESKSKEEIQADLDKLQQYYNYEWQDLREIKANQLLSHYIKELDIKTKFNKGFVNALVVGEEIYQCDIVGGEPTFEILNPLKLRVFKSGYSNRIEDADIIVYEDFWSPGRIIDTFYDVLTSDEITKLETYSPSGQSDEMWNYDERNRFINIADFSDGNSGQSNLIDNYLSLTGFNSTANYYDNRGNIRVIKCYWKSRRKIKKVKSYDEITGEEVYDFYPETYKIDKNKGEEEEIFWINEAWEGTKVGKDIYLNMKPRLVQYNRLSNPSRCHFGIVGSLYNMNESKPYSLVDMMKAYNYLYDAIHDKLNKAIASNWGKIVKLDLAQVPKGWEVNKWLYFAKINKIAVTDSFKEGQIGVAKGKLAGNMNNNSNGVIDAETGQNIQQNINLLEFIKMEMSEVAGISKQREGQVSNRETVGGVERATLQSSHITEWLFLTHDDVKKRALECFLETAKIAMKGRSKKFQNIVSDYAISMVDIDGDEFSECDYGLVVDNNSANDIKDKLTQLAQAGLQTQTLSFSTIMKIYNNNNSISDIQRMIEKDENTIRQNQTQQAQQAQETQERMLQMNLEDKKADRELKDLLNQRDNDTKLTIAQLKLGDSEDGIDIGDTNKDDLAEKIRQFDEKIAFDRSKHTDEVNLKNKELELKDKSLNKPSNTK